MKIAFLGDSVTFGYGVRKKENWVSKAAEMLNVEAVNLGITGDTTGGMLVRFQTEVLPQKPDAVFIMGGYNDIFAGESDADARRNIMSIVHQAVGRGVIPILGIPPKVLGAGAKPEWSELFDFAKALEISARYCAWLRKFAETFQLPLVDFDQEFTKRMQENPEEIGYLDGLHPNLKGQQTMAEVFCDAIRNTPIMR